jgi:hypothetical protein
MQFNCGNTMTFDTKIALLLDKQDIYEVVCRFCRGADRLDRELMLSCYHPGALYHYAGYDGTVEGSFEWGWDWLSGLDGTMHTIGNHLIEVNGDKALSETYVNSYHWGTPRSDPNKNYRTGTRYIDRFERRNGEWRIAERWMLRAFARSETDAGELSVPDEVNNWPKSKRDRTDPIYTALRDLTPG